MDCEPSRSASDTLADIEALLTTDETARLSASNPSRCRCRGSSQAMPLPLLLRLRFNLRAGEYDQPRSQLTRGSGGPARRAACHKGGNGAEWRHQQGAVLVPHRAARDFRLQDGRAVGFGGANRRSPTVHDFARGWRCRVIGDSFPISTWLFCVLIQTLPRFLSHAVSAHPGCGLWMLAAHSLGERQSAARRWHWSRQGSREN